MALGSAGKAEDSGGAHFEDLNHNGKYEFIGNDWTFAYWHASFAESPAPRVILRAKPGEKGTVEYRLAMDLMAKSPPSSEKFQNLVATVKGNENWSRFVPAVLWSEMLDFIYTGNPDLAWKLWDETWPTNRPSKGGFLGAFCERLSDSPYFTELEDNLGQTPPDCFSGNDSFGPPEPPAP